MLPDKLDDINEAFLQGLCDADQEESSRLDFKQSLPCPSDKDRKEFAKDVCAMANAEGGYLVYGVVEKEGIAGHLRALSFEKESPDDAKQRLTNIMNSHLDPHLTDVRFKVVSLEGGYILVVRVPRSSVGPHCVRGKDKKRTFVKRDGVLTRHLDYEELRQAFNRSDTLQTIALNFRAERLEKIKKGKVWGSLSEGPYCVLHWIPISTEALFDSYSIGDRDFSKFIRLEGGTSGTPNQEGIRYHYIVGDEASEYGNGIRQRLFWNAQIFRSGALEMAFALPFMVSRNNKERWVNLYFLISNLRKVMDGFKDGMSLAGYTGRMVVGVSILFMKNYAFADAYGNYATSAYSEDHLVLKEETVDDFQSVDDIVEIELPILNVLFQSFGLRGSPYYDENRKRIYL